MAGSRPTGSTRLRVGIWTTSGNPIRQYHQRRIVSVRHSGDGAGRLSHNNPEMARRWIIHSRHTSQLAIFRLLLCAPSDRCWRRAGFY